LTEDSFHRQRETLLVLSHPQTPLSQSVTTGIYALPPTNSFPHGWAKELRFRRSAGSGSVHPRSNLFYFPVLSARSGFPPLKGHRFTSSTFEVNFVLHSRSTTRTETVDHVASPEELGQRTNLSIIIARELECSRQCGQHRHYDADNALVRGLDAKRSGTFRQRGESNRV
jgi:hypothetical protein